MDLEREKQLSNEYTKQQVFQHEDLKSYREAMEFYEIKKDAMTRQERRAYERRLVKENNRKH